MDKKTKIENYKFKNGDTYTGEMTEIVDKNGNKIKIMHGKGKLETEQRDFIYDGEFKNGKQEGSGKLIINVRNGSEYNPVLNGEWRANYLINGEHIEYVYDEKQQDPVPKSKEITKIQNGKPLKCVITDIKTGAFSKEELSEGCIKFEIEYLKQLCGILNSRDVSRKSSEQCSHEYGCISPEYGCIYISEKDKPYRKQHQDDELLLFLAKNAGQKAVTVNNMNTRKNIIYKNEDTDKDFKKIKDNSTKNFIKIQYCCHGTQTNNENNNIIRSETASPIDDKIMQDIDIKNAKTLYVSCAICGGSFVDKEGNDIVKILQKNMTTGVIGFLSIAKEGYTMKVPNTIDNNSNIGLRRVFEGTETKRSENKEKLEYYMILIDKSGQYHIYSIPYNLCYFREDLIRTKQFLTVVNQLLQNGVATAKIEVIPNDGIGEAIEKKITFEGEIKEMLHLAQPRYNRHFFENKIQYEYNQKIKEQENEVFKKRCLDEYKSKQQKEKKEIASIVAYNLENDHQLGCGGCNIF